MISTGYKQTDGNPSQIYVDKALFSLKSHITIYIFCFDTFTKLIV